jgi:hypothetical protein
MVANWRKDFADPRDLERFARWRKKDGRTNPYLKKKSATFNPFTDEQLASEQFRMAYAVYSRLRDGSLPTHAYYLAAKDLGLLRT